MEQIGCLSNNNNFPDDFTENHPLLKLLPDEYDICYLIKQNPGSNVTTYFFYLHDSINPVNTYDSDIGIGSITFYIDTDDDDISIGYLSVNENLNDFELRHSSIGSFLLYMAISYAEYEGIETIKLDDDSDGFRTDNNIYLKIGLKYEEDYGPEMIGDVSTIYLNMDKFIEEKGELLNNKLNELTEYHDDSEWEYSMDVDDY